MKKKVTNEKENGRIYTPDYIVKNILDLSGYQGAEILGKHIIDNSCGNGAFLREIVRRYCQAALDRGHTADSIARQLSTYVHGIEIDRKEHEDCMKKGTAEAENYGITGVSWDIRCGDATAITDYNGRMDYVVGNPPYVRVHNLGDSFENVKSFSFAQNGMTDLYIVFFELGLRMLNDSGILGYITPSSYFNSVAGAYMREYFIDRNLLKAVVDLKHFQAFHATTYTAITILANNRQSRTVDYYAYDAEQHQPRYVDTLTPEDYKTGTVYSFASRAELRVLREISDNIGESDIAVKNGYATLCDKVFVREFDFESPHIIPVVKSSRGKWERIVYPYDTRGKLLEESDLQKDEKLYQYLLSNKETLLDRSNESENWYAFGRSQAIGDTYRDKLSVNTLIRGAEDLKCVEVPAGTGVYSGLYVVSDSVPLYAIADALKTEEFANYVSLLGKYKSGGYYTFSSKDVKKYLNYKFAYDRGLLC